MPWWWVKNEGSGVCGMRKTIGLRQRLGGGEKKKKQKKKQKKRKRKKKQQAREKSGTVETGGGRIWGWVKRSDKIFLPPSPEPP
jgi:hypothetical protein